MKHLLLLRHAKARRPVPGEADIDRPLAPRGRRAAQAVGKYLKKAGWQPELVLCSTSRRTRETWAKVASQLDGAYSLEVDARLYLASADTLSRRLADIADRVSSVLVVGHNPGLQELAGRLAASADPEVVAGIADKLPTAAFVWFTLDIGRWTDVAPDTARVAAYVTPANLDDQGEP